MSSINAYSQRFCDKFPVTPIKIDGRRNYKVIHSANIEVCINSATSGNNMDFETTIEDSIYWIKTNLIKACNSYQKPEVLCKDYVFTTTQKGIYYLRFLVYKSKDEIEYIEHILEFK